MFYRNTGTAHRCLNFAAVARTGFDSIRSSAHLSFWQGQNNDNESSHGAAPNGYGSLSCGALSQLESMLADTQKGMPQRIDRRKRCSRCTKESVSCQQTRALLLANAPLSNLHWPVRQNHAVTRALFSPPTLGVSNYVERFCQNLRIREMDEGGWMEHFGQTA